jgi:hypothetical protein
MCLKYQWLFFRDKDSRSVKEDVYNYVAVKSIIMRESLHLYDLYTLKCIGGVKVEWCLCQRAQSYRAAR